MFDPSDFNFLLEKFDDVSFNLSSLLFLIKILLTEQRIYFF